MQLDGMGLTDAVRDLVTDFQLKHPALRIALHVAQPLPALADGLEISAFRIVQEALTNVVRHAHASEATLQLTLQPETLEIVVADNGTVDMSALLKSGHYGVRGMQERAESLGGSLRFANPTRGLEIRVRLPLVDPVAAGLADAALVDAKVAGEVAP